MPIQFDQVKNLVKLSVSTGYDDITTAPTLTAGLGALLPAPPFNLTWWNSTDYGDPSDDPNVEIIRVVGVSGDTLAIYRGQEGTAASTKNTAGKTYTMILGLTALTLSNVVTAFNTVSSRVEELQTNVQALVTYLVGAGFDLPEELLTILE